MKEKQSQPRQWIWGLVSLATVIVGLGIFNSTVGGSSCQVADSKPRTLQPSDVAKIQLVGTAGVSPDGKHVAYMRLVPRKPGKDKDGGFYRELHITDLDGNSRPFVSGKVAIKKIKWSRDSKRIMYLAKRFDDKHASLYSIPIDGGESRAVLRHTTGISNYALSPDGKRLVFLAKDKQDKEAKEAKKSGYNAKVYEEEPRPTKVWAVALDDGRAPTKAEAKEIPTKGSVSYVHYSPDGKTLLLARAPTPTIDDYYMKRDLVLVDAQSGKQLGSYDRQGKLGMAAFNPRGDKVAVISAVDKNDPSEGRLMVGNAKGGALKAALPPDAQEHVRGFGWQNDDTLVFVSDRGTQTVVGTVKADGSELKVLVGPQGPTMSHLSVSSSTGVVAVVGDAPQHPAEVFGYTIGKDKEAKRLTKHNPWLKDVVLGKQEVVRYKSRDGLEVEGILVRPAGQEDAKNVPLVLVVHGGPESHVRNGWVTNYSRPGQTGAALGWAVFYPNYRGSTGRGVAFSKKGQADYAGGEFNDLVDAIAHFDKTGLIDKSKVGITGGSYGGYASAWAATKLTKHFAASVMFVGISDQISKVGTTDIPNEMFQVHARRWPWKHWDWFRERSPIHYIEQARTPILIMHGEKDPRVHPSQSLELYRYLKLIGKTPVRLVLYPNEGHGNRRAAARLDYSLRQLRWLKHYLTGPKGSPPPHAVDHAKAMGEKSKKEKPPAAAGSTP